ncbi:MAG: type II toxin-antitoxin system HipA family toxin YjjJ [Pseudomonadota bacterium]
MALRVSEHLNRGPTTAADLAQRLGVSQPTISRALRPLEATGRVVRFGRTRGARYGLARDVRGLGSRWPLYRIDEAGLPHEITTLVAVERDHYYAPGGPSRIEGLGDGLPYYLQDARPAGFLGRAVPSRYPELELPPRVVDWTDDHVLAFLARRGSDTVGDLVLGRESLNRYLEGDGGPPLVRDVDRVTRYPELATQAMAGAPAGSSAQGEHPKFSVRVERGGDAVHAFVKFSPPRDTRVGERWADLLACEALASDFLRSEGVAAARSHVVESGTRVFLESERFDRVGSEGRRGVVTLLAIDAQFHGELDRWTSAAQRLHEDGLLSAEDAERVALLDAFGALIANTDRHLGNLTLFDRREGRFELAPVYDMLPMLFAPSDGDLVERPFKPQGARAESLSVWPRARELALGYWTRLVEEPRLTGAFRRRAAECRDLVARTRLRSR